MATKIKLGNGNWGVKPNGVLAYNDENNVFKAIELQSSRASGATYVAQSGLITDSPLNTPRIDFQDDSNGALLLEPQSTNKLPYSEDFTNPQWLTIGSVTITANYGISPDGTLNSTRVQFSAVSESLYEAIGHTIGDTASIYVKGTSGETIRFGAGANVAVGQDFTLNGEWQRLEFQSTGTAVFCIGTYNSTTARDIEVWGAQLEALSYATSYIPTSGATATRIAETCSKSGLENYINSSEGVLYVEAAKSNSDESEGGVFLRKDTNNEIRLNFAPNNRLNIFVNVGGSNVVYLDNSNYDLSQYHKIAIKYKLNDYALYFDGLKIFTDTSATVPSGLNELSFNRGGITPFYGKVKDVRVYDTALSDSQLKALTS